MSVKAIFEKILQDDTEGIADAFIKTINSKLIEDLEHKREEIASSMFGQSVLDNTDDKVNEETESLDEISGATLGSYIQKARKQDGDKRAHARELDLDPKVQKLVNKRMDYYNTNKYTSSGANKHQRQIQKTYDDELKRKKELDPDYPDSAIPKRHKGIEKAVSRLLYGKMTNETVDTLDENAIKSSSLQAGNHYYMHDGQSKDHVVFNGWTDDDEQYGNGGPKYKHIKEIPDVKSLRHIENKSNGKKYGYQHYANFTAMKDGKPDYDFNAYVHGGRLSVGTGASPVSFSRHTVNEMADDLEEAETEFRRTEFSGKVGKYWKSPGEVSGTRKIKGTGYGNQYDTDENGDSIEKTADVTPEVKRGRGRPKKDTGDSGGKFDASGIAELIKAKIGKLPIGKSRKIIRKQ